MLAVSSVKVFAIDTNTDSSGILILQADDGKWHLQARQAKLPRLLNAIGEHTATKLHYSRLPDGWVDANCIGIDAASLLKCLLGDAVNMATQVSIDTEKNGSAKPLKELWIMETSLTPQNSQCKGAFGETSSEAISHEASVPKWLRQAADRRPTQRMQAIAELSRLDVSFDGTVRPVLEKALGDQDSGVRLEAIGGIAARDGEAAVIEPLRQALKDPKSDIRLMALDYIDNDIGLLQLATQDTNSAVRALATEKLEMLSKQ